MAAGVDNHLAGIVGLVAVVDIRQDLAGIAEVAADTVGVVGTAEVACPWRLDLEVASPAVVAAAG